MTGGVDKRVSKDIVWDASKTTILSARLHGKIWAQLGTKGLIKLNGADMLFADATLADVTVEDTVDVIGTLRNGTNTVEISLWKSIYVPLDKIGTFTAEIIIEYEGASPEEKPWYYKYIVPAAIGTASAVAVAIAFITGRRK